MKAQTSVVLILLVIVIFAGLVVTLLQLAQSVNREEYINLYTHTLLRSILRADTGYMDSNCRAISDLITCAYFSPTYICEGSGMECRDLAQSQLSTYMSKYELISQNFNYLLQASPSDFLSDTDISMGDTSLDSSRPNSICRKQSCWTAQSTISKTTPTTYYTIKVKLTISKNS